MEVISRQQQRYEKPDARAGNFENIRYLEVLSKGMDDITECCIELHSPISWLWRNYSDASALQFCLGQLQPSIL